MINEKNNVQYNIDSDDWLKAKCDKYDYMIAVFCGGVAGLIDVFFVGDPLTSVLGKEVDKVADGFVKKAAQFFWKHDKREKGKSKKMPQTLVQCISYLEQAFPVSYDARYAKDLVVEEGVLGGMRPSNHHLLSLAHSPDLIGLIFSIIDQFRDDGSFVDKGKIIHVVPKKKSGAVPYMLPYMQGTDLVSRIICGFFNWLGHLISDLVGSSSTRRGGKKGRGAGIPIPFYELFLECDFGDFDGKTLSETMISVFEKGYDVRFCATMSIPVIINELMIKVIWMIRQKYYRRKTWKESMPTYKHADLRVMLIVGNTTFCVVDGANALYHGIKKDNIVSFICHLNLVGWTRLLLLVLRELRIRFGTVIDEIINKMMEDIQTPAEKRRIQEFLYRLEEYDQDLAAAFAEFVENVEKEYRELYIEIEATFDETRISSDRAEHSVKLAQVSGVDEDRIVKSHKELDDFFE